LDSGRFIVDDSRLGVQFDEAEARTLRLIHDVPLAVVVHEWPMASFGSLRWQGLRPDLAAVATDPAVQRRDINRAESAARKFHVHVVPAVVQQLDCPQ
jgi:hypothetical protein